MPSRVHLTCVWALAALALTACWKKATPQQEQWQKQRTALAPDVATRLSADEWAWLDEQIPQLEAQAAQQPEAPISEAACAVDRRKDPVAIAVRLETVALFDEARRLLTFGCRRGCRADCNELWKEQIADYDLDEAEKTAARMEPHPENLPSKLGKDFLVPGGIPGYLVQMKALDLERCYASGGGAAFKTLQGHRLDLGDATAAGALRTACDKGCGLACVEAAELALPTTGSKRPAAPDAEKERRGCDHGSGLGCLWRGLTLEATLGSPASDSEAKAFYAKACHLGVSIACQFKPGSPSSAKGLLLEARTLLPTMTASLRK